MFLKALVAALALSQSGVYATDCPAVEQPGASSSLLFTLPTTSICTAPAPAPVIGTTAAPTTAAPTAAPTTAAPTVAPTDAPTAAPTKAPNTTKAQTTKPPTTMTKMTTCKPQLCEAATTVKMTTTNTSTTTSTTSTSTTTVATTTNTSTTTSTSVTTATTTNITTVTPVTVTTTNTTTTPTTATTTNTSTVYTSTSTTNTSTTTSTTTASTTNTTKTTVTMATTTNTSATTTTSTTTATTTNTTVTTVPMKTTTNTSSTTSTTTITMDPCVCFTTTAPARRLADVTEAPVAGCATDCIALAGRFAKDNACGKAVASGKTATCTAEANTLFYACMPSFEVKCPANNVLATRMPFVVASATVAKPVQCQACGVTPLGVDMDPTPGQYWVNLAWGPNMLKSSSTGMTLSESHITGYEIRIVNERGEFVGTEKVRVPSRGWSSSTTCCDKAAYSIGLAGTWPEGGSAFMILPYQTMKDGNLENTYTLPIGTMTSEFTDVMIGTVTQVVQTVALKGMTEAHARLLQDSPFAKETMAKSIAASDKEGKIKAFMVVIEKIQAKPSARRLAEPQGRRLAGWQVDVAYKILLPADYTSTFDATSIDAALLKTAVETEAKKNGMDITVGSAELAAPTATVMEGNNAATTGAANRMSGSILSSFIALVVALALA